MAEVKRVCFIGLGIMGSRQAANLARAGFGLTVYNRTRERAEEFARRFGAEVASTPAQAAAGADVTITMVVDFGDVEEVLFGADGAAASMSAGSLAIDMSTISPTATKAIAARLADGGVRLLDAPVTGSAPRAEDGTLTIMVGGAREDFERALPVFQAMGRLVIHMGPQGDGQMTKLLQNSVTAANMAVLGQVLGIAREARLDREKLLEVLASGTSASAALDAKAQAMLDSNFEPHFKLAHMLKDLRHTLAEASNLDARLEIVEASERLFAEVAAADHATDDVAAIALASGKAQKGTADDDHGA